VRDATGQLMMPRKRLGEESAVCANLDAIAKYRQALALENPDPASAMRGKFELDLLRLADGAWTVAEPDPDRGLVVFDEGNAIAIRVVSGYARPAYISLVDFGLTGAMSLVYPPTGAQEQLCAGSRFDLGTNVQPPVTVTWPADYPFEGAA